MKTKLWSTFLENESLHINDKHDDNLSTMPERYFCHQNMSHLMGKPTICIGENKGADQLRGNREADQRLRYSDSTIPLLLKFEISSF